MIPTIHQIKVGDDYLYIVAKGSVKSAPEMLDYIKMMYKGLARTGLSRVLINETRCHMHITFDGLLEVASALNSTKEFNAMRKTAVVTSNANHPLFQHIFDSLKKIKIFRDEEEAREWLMS